MEFLLNDYFLLSNLSLGLRKHTDHEINSNSKTSQSIYPAQIGDVKIAMDRGHRLPRY